MMAEVVTVSVGIGLVLSLIFSELFSLVAGGMVVPGYLALSLNDPVALLVTMVIALVTWVLVMALGQYIILYGRRRTALMILVGFLLGWLTIKLGASWFPEGDVEIRAIGHIIPGLIAIWFERQGPVATTATLVISIVIIRLSLILLYGTELPV